MFITDGLSHLSIPACLAALLIALLIGAVGCVYRRCYKKQDDGRNTALRPSALYFGNVVHPAQISQESAGLAQFLAPLILKDEPFPPSNDKMLSQLLHFRFPFTPLNLGPEFPQAVHDAMVPLPPVLLQLLLKHRATIELDVVCDIPAMMDPAPHGSGPPKLMLSRYFVLDDELYRTESNPLYPYGLHEIILHELGHYLDWFLHSHRGRLSATPEFLQAFQDDVHAIPSRLLHSYDTCDAWRRQYGGVLRLPRKLRYQSDLSMFVHQEEEVFGEAFLYLMTGQAREIVVTHFPRAIEAVDRLVREGLLDAARKASERLAS